MKQNIHGLFIVLMALVLLSCPNPAVDTPVVLTPSTIVFADGATVQRQIGSGNYTNAVSGDGTGAITYESGTTTTATVNATTGEVTLVAVGSTVITATKVTTATHETVTNTYTLTVTAIPVIFSALAANGTSGSVTTTALTLFFDVDPTTLAASDITVTGATKGTLSGIGTFRTLTISAISVTDGENVAVTLSNPIGFAITPASKDVTIKAILYMVTIPTGSFQRDAIATEISMITTAYKMSEKEITMEQFVEVTGMANPSTDFTTVVNGPVQQTPLSQDRCHLIMNGGDGLEVQFKDTTSGVAQGASASKSGGEGCGPRVRNIGAVHQRMAETGQRR